MDATIRPYVSDDEGGVVALWHAADLVVPWNDPRRDIARKCADDPSLFAVADRGGVIVGTVMAGYDGHRGWVNYLAVAPELRRRGLGRRLMAWAEERLVARGCPKVNLQVRAGNAAAIRFYEAIGYAPDDVVSLGRRLVADGRPVAVGPAGSDGCVPYGKDTRLVEVDEE